MRADTGLDDEDDSSDDDPDGDDMGMGDFEPYTTDMPGEPPGKWYGQGAAALGLTGMIHEDPYRRVFRGLHPFTEEPLVQNANKPDRRPGWEGCQSLPKDVSAILFGSTEERREGLLQELRSIPDSVVRLIEQRFAFSRVGKAEEGCERVPVGLVTALWEHASSRAGDEDWHTHIQFFNLGVDRHGKFRAIDPRPIFVNQRVITAWGRAKTAWLLRTKFGLTAEVRGSTYRIRGVPEEVVVAKSKRRKQILDHMAERGESGGEAAQRANLETRPRKDKLVSRAELIRKWKADNALTGFTEAYIEGLMAHGPLKPVGSIAKVIRLVVKQLTRKKNHFSRQELLLETLYRLPEYGLDPEPIFDEVEKFLKKDPNIVSLGTVDGGEHYTTKQILREERQMLDALDRMSKRTRQPVSDKNLNRELRKRPTLKQEQIDFIRHLTQSTSSLGLGQGLAGVGKTFATKTGVDAAKRQGYRVRGVSESAQAAEVLARETGIECQTLTKALGDFRLPLSAAIHHHVRQFWRAARRRRTWRFRQPRPVEITPRDIILADESGMITTRRMRLLAEAVERGGGILWLIGDPAQLPSVDSTPPFLALTRRYGGPILKEICRQKDEWAREAATLFAEGKVGPALAMFAEHKLVTVRDDLEEVVRQACLDWTEEGLLRPDRVLILANTNKLTHAANHACQEHRLRAGCIRPSVSIAISDEQEEAVYESRIFRGDRVACTENSTGPKGYGVRNGSRGSVIEINTFTSEIAVLLDNKKYVKINVRKYPHIRLGYAVTTYKSQGASIPRILAIVGGSLQNLPSSYVQASRAIEQTQFYTTRDLLSPSMENIAESPLAKQMSRRPDLRLATELLEAAPLDLRTPKLPLRKVADSILKLSEGERYLAVAGMPRSFWIVSSPTPGSVLEDICVFADFKRFAAAVKGDPAVPGKRIVAIYSKRKDAVAAASQLLEPPYRPIPAHAPIEIHGMPRAFWLVAKPTPASTLADFCFPISFDELARLIRDGLDIQTLFGVCATQPDASATASHLIETMLQGDIAEIPISHSRTPLNISGMPGTFWVVTMPTPSSRLRQVCFHTSFAGLLSLAKDRLPVEAIAGIYGQKEAAVAAAVRLVKAVRRPKLRNAPAVTGLPQIPLAGFPPTFWVVKIPTLNSNTSDILLECNFQQLVMHGNNGLSAKDIAAICTDKNMASDAAARLLESARETRSRMVAENRIPPPLPPAIIPAIAEPPAAADIQLPPPSRPAPLPLPPLPLETATTASEPPRPLTRTSPPGRAVPTPQTAQPAAVAASSATAPQPVMPVFSADDGYQRLRLPAVTRHVTNGSFLLASCVDGGSRKHCHRPPPPPGQLMPYAADSVRVQRIVPAPSATMPLSAVTALGMFSLQGTGCQDRVQVDCNPGERWILTVSDSLGLISAQDDIAGALTLYGKPAITHQLEYLDQTENELRRFLPGQCFLLSLFSCVRREISWLLPTAADPSAVTLGCLQRLCEMLFYDPVANDLFAWFGRELRQTDEPAVFIAMQRFLQDLQYRPSEDTLRHLCYALANGLGVQDALNECVKSLRRQHPAVPSDSDFQPSITGLLRIADIMRATIAERRLSPQQQQGIFNALCNAAELTFFPLPHFFDVLAHPFQIDHQRFDGFPPLAHVWQYATNYVRGQQAEMNRKYRAFLDD
jgi:conjugative relaxase-like TrwC/TraI family protein